MLTALALTAALSADQVVLYRGCELAGEPIRYWDVQDTVLDVSQPDMNFGGEYTISTGTGKVMLIRFGDLKRAVGHGRKISSARLVLNYSSSEKPVFHGISRVQSPWGEGPILTLAGLKAALPAAPGMPVKGPITPRGSATWKQCRAGIASWQQPGAADSKPIDGAKCSVLNDHELAIEGLGATCQAMADRWYENDGFAITFDNAVEIDSCQAHDHRPKLEIATEAAAKPSGADLSVVRIEQHGGNQFIAHVANVGDSAAQGFVARWAVDERQGSSIEIGKALQPGEETTLDTTANPQSKVALLIAPKGADANASNDSAEWIPGGSPVSFFIQPAMASKLRDAGVSPIDWAAEQVRLFDDTVLAQSKFSFAPEGARARLNLGPVTTAQEGSVAGEMAAVVGPDRADVQSPETQWPLASAFRAFLAREVGQPTAAYTVKADLPGYKSLDGSGSARFPGLLGWGDTQCEGTIAPQLTLPYQAVWNPIFEGLKPEPTDLLSATMVQLINESAAGGFKPGMFEELPRTVLVRALDYNNQPLKDTELSFWLAGVSKGDAMPAFTGTTGSEGTVLLATKPGSDGHSNPFGQIGDPRIAFMVKASGNGQTDWALLPAWELFDAYSRGNKAAAVFDLHFNLPSMPLDTVNLAKNRILTDSAGSTPAQLAALVDENLRTSAPLGGSSKDWIEVDLGRDRPIGEVRLAFDGPFWQKYDLIVYSTGQKPEDASIWSREIDFHWSIANNAAETDGVRTIAYRGGAQRFRFLRICNRVDGQPVKLAEIKVFAAAPTSAP